MSVDNSKFKVVWGALEREGKTFWTRIGLGWEAKSGEVYAQLSAYPLSGRICIKDGPEEALALAASVGEEALQ
jgi:hypothetical protein